MPELPHEHVLVVPAAVFHRIGHFQGFSREVDRYLPSLLDRAHMSFQPRHQVEHDPSYKQLIPYVIFRHVPSHGMASLFQYTRGTGQGEGRLHRKRSIGIGGHISSRDATPHADTDPYQEGMRRELEEEVVIETPYAARCVGLINDDQTDVGRVHLGVVYLADVQRPAVYPREPDLVDGAFRPVDQLLAERHGFESWSEICLEALFGQGAACLAPSMAP